MVWTPEFLAQRFNLDHPLEPVRLDLTMRLAGELGVLEGVDFLEPEPAPDAELERVHVPSYLEAVRAAPEMGDDFAHGLGTDDNPIFEGMHEASCLVCGAHSWRRRPVPPSWVAYASRLTSHPLPTEMTDGADVAHAPWLTGTDRVDVAILETRRAVFPLHGLDPHDPRD